MTRRVRKQVSAATIFTAIMGGLLAYGSTHSGAVLIVCITAGLGTAILVDR